MKYFLLLFSLCILTVGIEAQDYDSYFTDKTLRIDYTFSGNSKTQTISLDQLCQLPL